MISGRAGFIDQDGVDFIHHGKVQGSLYPILFRG